MVLNYKGINTGDDLNSNTDGFYRVVGDYLLKQVDDMYIQAVSIADLEAMLKVAAKDVMDHGFTRSISKFFAGRPVNIVSGFKVVLDPSGPYHIKLFNVGVPVTL